jgi:putative membrane protein
MKKLYIFLSGMAMGMVETIPGVSGGTVAFVLGIYDRLIGFISAAVSFAKDLLISLPKFKETEIRKKLFAQFKQLDWVFAINLGIGMVIAIAIFSNLFSFLLQNYPMQTFGAFFGMIIASILAPLAQIKKTLVNIALIGISFVAFFMLFGMPALKSDGEPGLLFVFVGGVIGISAMVLPGISGSFILLTLGLYEFIISRVASFTKLNFSGDVIIPLIVFALGIIVGVAGFVKLLEYALKNYRHIVLSRITGLLIASLRVLWPFLDVNSGTSAEYMEKIMPNVLSIDTLISIYVYIGLGFALVAVFLKKKKPTKLPN